MVDLLEGEREDMERSFWVGLEDGYYFFHLLIDLRVTFIPQHFLKDLWKLADDLDVLERDVQLSHSFRACKLDDLHKFSLVGLGNDHIFQQLEDLAEEIVLIRDFGEQILEGSVGVAFPKLAINEDMVEDDDVDNAEVREEIDHGIFGPFLAVISRSAPHGCLKLREGGS